MSRREQEGGAVVASQRCPLKRGTAHLPDFNPYYTEVETDPVPAAPAEYAGMSLRSIYAASCDANGCRKNTSLLRMLPSTTEEASSLKSLDLSLNFVGKIGIRPVLDVVRNASCLENLNISDNFLDNSSISELVATVDGLTQLTSIDLSKNPISQTGGKLINTLARNNSNIQNINVSGTLINPALKSSILQKVVMNKNLSQEDKTRRFKQQAALRGNYHQQQEKRLRRVRGSKENVNLDVLMVLASEKDPTGAEYRNLTALVDSIA
eukprot:TRINITY_DN17973_c0_g1_i1.p1 TRINITY_DN17973_c0_g1~~TRINITY_DN17973_c0_g1_i1.p1  ORF type:complete len:266 (+),score=24.86 TRINITY_DN17973_c0_g1_i1:80-877(+)